jgi:ubiquinone/menaquinone biosynthesis C-methylase UbiE
VAEQGWKGWDEYAPFYDWENARTLGRRDVAFWQRVARDASGRVLELGCGTGRISLPLARSGIPMVGIDRSEPMLGRAARRKALLKKRPGKPRSPKLGLIRGDITALPFQQDSFGMVLAPYGILQSLLSDRDLEATLTAVSRVLRPGGVFGVDLVPDVPQWREYRNRVQMRGRAVGGVHLTLVESVRQDRAHRVTIFEQEYRVQRGRTVTVHPFTLRFRTLPVRRMTARLERAGFVIRAILGDYRGRPWDERADVWIILAEKV